MSNANDTKALSKLARREAVRPSVDVLEDENRITLRADLPGVTPENLNVAVEGKVLTIEAAAKLETTPDMKVAYAEFRTPYYLREFTLSSELDPAAIEAAFQNGVLHLSIPKREHAKPRRIDVQVA